MCSRWTRPVGRISYCCVTALSSLIVAASAQAPNMNRNCLFLCAAVTYCGSSQEAGPPPVEAVGEPVAIDSPQARDVIVDVMDIQRD